MGMQTGESEQGLRKILDMTRLISIVLLGTHFYYYCYATFGHWQLTATLTDRILANIHNTGLFTSFNKSKWIAICFLLISLIGVKGSKNERFSYKTALMYLLAGLLIYSFSYLSLLIKFKIATAASL